MNSKKVFMIAASLTVAASTSAFAARSDVENAPTRVQHKHHLAHYVNPNTASDADRDSGMYVVKPQTEPEYFGHASGSDGSMPQ